MAFLVAHHARMTLDVTDRAVLEQRAVAVREQLVLAGQHLREVRDPAFAIVRMHVLIGVLGAAELARRAEALEERAVRVDARDVFLDVPLPHRQAAGVVRHADALDHAAVLGFRGFGALQRFAQPLRFRSRAHGFGERERFGLRLAHVGGTEEAGCEDREHGDRVTFQVRPPVAVVGRQHRCDQHQQRADRGDQRDVPVPVRGQREHDGEQVADADCGVEHVGDVEGEDPRAHHQQPRQEIAAAVQIAAQTLDDRVAALFLRHLDQAAQVVAQAEGAEQQQRHQEVAEPVHRQVRLAEEAADGRALALQRQVEQQHAVVAVGDAIEKVRGAGDLLEARVRTRGIRAQRGGGERGLSAGGLRLRIRRERVLQV